MAKSGRTLSIGQNMLWNSAGSIINLGCQWLITVVIVRIASGYDAAGIYSLAMSVYGIFAPVAQYRMYTYQISDTKNENTTGEYFAFRIITSAIALAACMAYALVTCSSEALFAIFLYGLYRSAALLIDVFHACDQRHDRMDYIGISLGIQGVVTLGLFVITFLFTNSLEAALGMVTVGILAIGLIFDLPKTLQFGKIKPRITIHKTRHLLVSCLPIVIGALACAAAVAIPKQFLFDSFGEASLGIYASVGAPVALIQTGVSYVYYPLIGHFSHYYATRNTKAFYQLLIKVTIAIALVGCLCALLLELFGAQLLTLVFGSDIAQYTYLLQPLIASAIISALMWFANDLLIALRNFSGNFIGSLVALGVALACFIPFVNLWGMNGVSFTLVASCTLSTATMIAFLVRQLNASNKNKKQQQDELCE